MLQITKGRSNEVVVTATENATITNPVFLFRLISEGRNIEKTFIALNTSQFTDRYDLFTITESNTEDRVNATVSLDSGIWEYRIYEQTSATNLVWQNADNQTPLEIGLMKVHPSTSDSFHSYQQQATTFKW